MIERIQDELEKAGKKIQSQKTWLTVFGSVSAIELAIIILLILL